jgi:acetyl esterase/lipase
LNIGRSARALGVLLASGCCQAQQVVPLWEPGEAPYGKPHEVEEYEAPCWFTACAYQVHQPTLTIFKPEGGGTGDVILILPGGGYDVLAVYHEGYHIARAFAEQGVTSAVLKYRLPDPNTSSEPGLVPISDLRQALRLLRENQDQYQIRADRVGVLGFSAGAHLATQASVHPLPEAAANPDFSILVYGVTRLTPENRQWLEDSLYHRPMTTAEIDEQTLLEHVDNETVPAFLVHALDDETCHYLESTEYAEALTAQGVEAELHLYAHGGHGFSLGREEDGTDQWVVLAADWLGRLD